MRGTFSREPWHRIEQYGGADQGPTMPLSWAVSGVEGSFGYASPCHLMNRTGGDVRAYPCNTRCQDRSDSAVRRADGTSGFRAIVIPCPMPARHDELHEWWP